MSYVNEHLYEILINEKHLDTFGHVNNATYLELYEEARWDLITKGGWGLDKIQKEKIGPVITSIKIDFKREIKNREKITIKTKFGSFRNSKVMAVLQQMINEKGDIVNEMTMEAGLFDLANRKLINPTPEWMKALGVEGDFSDLLSK